MIPNLLRRRTGLLLAATVCWAVMGALALGLVPGQPGTARAQDTATPAVADDAQDDAAATADAAEDDGTGTADQAPATDDSAAADDGADSRVEDDGAATDDSTADSAEGDGAAVDSGSTAADSDAADTAADDSAAASDEGDGAQMDDGAQAADEGGDDADTADADSGDTVAEPPPSVTPAPVADTAPAPSQGASSRSASSGGMSGGSMPSSGTSMTSTSSMSGMGAEISWGQDYRSWERTTGFVSSAAHGNRLLVTYVTPADAARVYRGNAAVARNSRQSGFQRFPAGTQIVAESFRKGAQGKPGPRGPLFFMKKDAGGNWSFAFTGPDFRLIGEGTSGRVAFCQSCHMNASARDGVYATDR